MLTDWAKNHPDINVKIHLSVHGVENRHKIVSKGIKIEKAIEYQEKIINLP